MPSKRLTKISRFLSYHLRHAPEKLELTLEKGGWISIVKLLKAAQKHQFPISLTELEEVVKTNDKQRFSFDEMKTRIRANQGHSIPVDLQLVPKTPPSILYHGTYQQVVKKIKKDGLKKMSRHHVHLSEDQKTAFTVGQRRGTPAVFQVNTQAMIAVGYEFYCSSNGVWLVDEVPPKYLTLKQTMGFDN
ncbi:MAG: RNA 2'-phosphotransferase [Cyanobacteria bacterium P01_G01_bin.49]